MENLDMQNPKEIMKWMIELIAYTVISNGREISEEDVHEAVHREILGKLKVEEFTVRDITKTALFYARGLIDECSVSSGVAVGVENAVYVKDWIVKTAALVCIANRAPFSHESLEHLISEEVFGRVQGNKGGVPNRQDLDLLVQRTVKWGLEKLNG